MTSTILTRRRLMAAGLALPGIAHAQATRPITLVHGFGSGGTTDAVARLMAEKLGPKLGRSMIVDARPGAGGTIAAGQVSRAAPDGATLLFLTGAHPISPAMFRNLPYDTLAGFTYVGLIAEYPFVLATSAEHPVRDLPGLVARAKQSAEPMTYSTSGVGTTNHLAMELFASRTGISLSHVPYRSSAQGALDVVARRIDFSIEGPVNVAGRLQDGSMRGLGVTSATRFFLTPEVPTFAEGGVPGYDVTTWSGIAGPAGMPPELVARLNAAMAEVLADPEVVQKIRQQGSTIATSTPEAFRSRIATEVSRWTEVVRVANIERI